MLNLDALRFVVDTSQLVDAEKRIESLGQKMEKLGNKSASTLTNEVTKASKKTKELGDAADQAATKVGKVSKATQAAGNPIEGLQNRLKNTFVDLSEGFTRGESAILNLARSLNASDKELNDIRAILADIGKLLKDPFDAAIGSVRSINKEYELLNQRASLVAQGITLTTKQLKEYSRISDEVAGKVKAQGLDPSQGKGLAAFNSMLKEQQADYLMIAQSVNKTEQAEKKRNSELAKQQKLMEDNASAGDAMVAQFRKIQEANIKEAEAIRRKTEAQKQFNAEFIKYSSMGYSVSDSKKAAGMATRGIDNSEIVVYLESARAQREAAKAGKEKEAADKKAATAAREREATERRMGDTMVAQYRKRQGMIDAEIRKLHEQRDALKASQSTVTGNVAFRLGNLGASAEQIRLAKELRKEIEELGKAARRTDSPLRGFASVMRELIPTLGALSGAAVVARLGNEFVKTGDYLITFKARLDFLSKGTLDFNDSFTQLVKISNEARTSVQDTSVFFSRLVPIMGSVGRNTKDAFVVTEAFSKLLLVSGTQAREASAAMYQLSQALGKGKLDGDEFRTVAEATPELLRILEKQLGVTRAELYKMSEQGKLTSDVIMNALIGSLDGLTEAANNMPKTVSGELTKLGNAATQFVKEMDESLKLTEGVASLISQFTKLFDLISENKEIVIGVIGALSGAATLVALGKAATAIGGIAGAAGILKGALIGLTALIAANPILAGLFVVGGAIGFAMTYESPASKSIDGITKKIERLKRDLKELNNDPMFQGRENPRAAAKQAELKELQMQRALLSSKDVYGNESRREESRQRGILDQEVRADNLAKIRRELSGFSGDYNKFIAKLNEANQALTDGLSRPEYEKLVSNIYSEFYKKPKRSDSDKAAEKLDDKYNQYMEKARDMAIQATGAQDDYTQAQKAMMDLIDDEVFAKFTDAQKQDVLNKYAQTHAQQLLNAEESTMAKYREKINDQTDESIRLQESYSKAQKLALDIFNDPAFAKLPEQRRIEIAQALELAHAEELVAKARASVKAETERLTEDSRKFETSKERTTFEFGLNGTPAQNEEEMARFDIRKQALKEIEDARKRMTEAGNSKEEIDNHVQEIQKLYEKKEAWVQVESQMKTVQEQSEQMAGIFNDAFSDLIKGGKSFGEVLEDLTSKIVNMAIEIMILEPLKASMTGMFKSAGGMSGILGSLFGGFFAEGGDPPVGKISMVGEKGPELFVPKTAGTIIPNKELGGGGTTVNQNVVFNISAPNGNVSKESLSQIQTAMGAATQRALRRNS